MFSEAECIRNGTVVGDFDSKPRVLPEIPINSLIRSAGLGQHLYGDWPVLWSHRSDVLLAGPSLVHIDQRGRACMEAMYGPHGWADPVWKRTGGTEVRTLGGNYTSLVSRWNDGKNYFHWFMDGLSRLVHLENFPADCGVIIPANLPSFAKRSLELLSLTDRVVETGGEDLGIEQYWFAGPTMLSGCPDPLGVSWLRERLLPKDSVVAHRHIYLERAAPTRNLLNHNEIRSFFQSNGWEVIDPAQLTLDEQIQMFRQARAVAAVHGASLSNLLWTPPGTKVIELMPKCRQNGCYAGVSLVLGLEHHGLVCWSDRHANLVADTSAIEKLL